MLGGPIGTAVPLAPSYQFLTMQTLPRHEALAEQRRWPWGQAVDVSLADWGVLSLCGFAASMLSLMEWDPFKGFPGHAILRAVLPLGCGMMFVPRRGAGTAMGLFAALTAFGHMLVYGAGGAGSLTSLIVLGPLLDISLLPVKKGRGAYFAFVAAGILANLAALLAQGIVKFNWPRGNKPFEVWLLTAGWTYPLFGLLAGLIAAAICFRWTDNANRKHAP